LGVDTAGARALAERIASGKPEDAQEARELQEGPKPRANVPPAPNTASPQSTVETVQLKPVPAARRDVRIYVRGRDGGLERRS